MGTLARAKDAYNRQPPEGYSEPPPMSQPFARLKHQLGAAFSDPTSDALIGGPMGFVPRGARLAHADIKGLMDAADSGIVAEKGLMSHPELLQQATTESPVSPLSNLAKDLANPKAYEALDAYSHDMARMGLNESMGRNPLHPELFEQSTYNNITAPQRAAEGTQLMRRYTNRER